MKRTANTEIWGHFKDEENIHIYAVAHTFIEINSNFTRRELIKKPIGIDLFVVTWFAFKLKSLPWQLHNRYFRGYEKKRIGRTTRKNAWNAIENIIYKSYGANPFHDISMSFLQPVSIVRVGLVLLSVHWYRYTNECVCIFHERNVCV